MYGCGRGGPPLGGGSLFRDTAYVPLFRRGRLLFRGFLFFLENHLGPGERRLRRKRRRLVPDNLLRSLPAPARDLQDAGGRAAASVCLFFAPGSGHLRFFRLSPLRRLPSPGHLVDLLLDELVEQDIRPSRHVAPEHRLPGLPRSCRGLGRGRILPDFGHADLLTDLNDIEVLDLRVELLDQIQVFIENALVRQAVHLSEDHGQVLAFLDYIDILRSRLDRKIPLLPSGQVRDGDLLSCHDIIQVSDPGVELPELPVEVREVA